MTVVAEELRLAARGMSAWPRRRWAVALAVTVLAGILTGLPTDIVSNPFYVRMTPILWWNYPVWALSALLLGLVTATYVRAPGGALSGRSGGGAFGGGLLSFLAIGCPICNKLVVALVGVSGALSIFAPLQPWLATIGLALLAVTLAVRVRGLARCRTALD